MLLKKMAWYRFGPFELHPDSRLLLRGGAPVPLTLKVLETLLFLVENRSRVLSKDELLAALWPDTVVEEANLAQNVSTLRKALGEGPKDRRYIATIPGRGYSFVAAVAEFSDEAGCGAIGEQPAPNVHPVSPRPHTSWLAGIAILVPLTGLVALSLYRNTSSGLPAALQPSPFTTLPDLEFQPAFSPDGRQVAYVTSKLNEETSAIYVKLVGAGTQIKLTSSRGRYSSPAWSPDGRYIAYWKKAGQDTGYYQVSVLGGPERLIAASNASHWSAGLDWFPDGKQLVISETSKSTEASPLEALNVDTGERRRLTSPPPNSIGDADPIFSPDGQTLAFVRYTAVDTTELHLISMADGNARQLPIDSPVYFRIAWTPDSREIVFSSPRGGCCGLWRLPVQGGSPKPVLISGQELADPVVSHQGGRLAYTVANANCNIWSIDLDGGTAGTPRRHLLISSTRRQSDPQYSPDGSRIAFWSDRTGSNEIWVSGSKGDTAVQLTNFAGPHTGSPRWSPDGARIVFDSRPGGNPDIFMVRADGGAPRRLTTSPAEDVVPSWSRDAQWVYFSSNRGGDFQIWKVPAATGETSANPAVQVTHAGGFGAFESADGAWPLSRQDPGKPGLWRLRLTGPAMGTEEPVLKSLQHWGWWALARDRIYYVEAADPLSGVDAHIKALDLRTGASRDLATLDKPMSGGNPILSVSPDESTLAYAQFDKIDSDIMLADHFK